MRRFALLFFVVAACTHEAPGQEPAPTAPTPTTPTTPPPTTTTAQPGVAFAQPPPVTPPAPVTPTPAPKPNKATTRVELTAVTLADDCGGTPPWSAPVKVAKAEAESDEPDEPVEPKAKLKADSASTMKGARARRRCEQTSMQLSIIASDASNIKVKSIELFDEAGKSLGKLSASKPTRWNDASGSYEAWDAKVAAGSTSSVSYVLTQPNWDSIGDRWNKTYTLKAVLSVGGVDQKTQKNVTLSAPTTLPPNVKT